MAIWNSISQWLGLNQPPGDRRGSPRYAIQLPLTVKAANGTLYRGSTLDMSEVGMSAVVSADLQIGDEVFLVYRFDDGSEAVRRGASVKTKNQHRYGFEFLPYEPAQLDLWGKLKGLRHWLCSSRQLLRGS